MRRFAMMLWLAVCASSVIGHGPAPPEADRSTLVCEPSSPLTALTAPRRRVPLGSVQQGRLSAVNFAEGDQVKEGDVLFSLDDTVQRANVDIAAARAGSTLEVDLARARWDRAERDREWRTKLHGDDRASPKEFEDSKSDAEVLGVEYKLAVFANDQAGRTLELQRRLLDQFHIKAPFDGYVTEVSRKAGESVDQFEIVLTLVQVDVLEVAIDCPISLAPCLREGDQLKITPIEPHWPARLGTIVLANQVADGASQTFKVKLLVNNKDRAWMAGIKVSIDPASLVKSSKGTGSVEPSKVPDADSAQPKEEPN